MEKKVFIFGFLVIITLPIILSTFGIRLDAKNTENRALAQSPVLKWEPQEQSLSGKAISLLKASGDFKDAFSRFYEDNFALKPLCFSIYYKLQTIFFGTDPLPKKVVTGNDGWYFLGNSFSNVISESKGLTNFSTDELELIRQNVNARNNWLDSLGIDYCIAVAPNKHSVYGHFLPITQASQATQLEQLKKLFQSSSIDFVNMGQYMDAEKGTQLYRKTNTHWNDYGAYLGYQSLMNTLQAKFPLTGIIQPKDYKVYYEKTNSEELTKMLAIHVEEDKLLIQIKKPKSNKTKRQLSLPNRYSVEPDAYENRYSNPNKPYKVLVFRDSFANGLIQFLNESFGSTVYIWSYEFDKELILKEKPDLVISEIVERNLEVLLPQ